MKNIFLVSCLFLLTGILNLVKAQSGSLDPDFNSYENGTRPSLTPTSANVAAIAIQPDGKIVMGGFFNVGGCGPTQGNQLLRMNPDGIIDGSFNPGFVNSNVFVVVMQSDGKFVVAGNFTSIGGVARNRIARLNADGTVDNGFNPGIGFNNQVRSVTVQSDGKLIVGGFFTTFNGTSANRIVRLNPDGSQDATFNPLSGFNNNVYSTALMADGRIMVGGQFSSYNGTNLNRIARLNADGTLDATFVTSNGFDGTVVNVVAVQPDGKILAGGNFNNYDGVPMSKLARLNSNGSLDATFAIGSGFNSTGNVQSLAIQPDGKIIVGGLFGSFNGALRYGIVRLFSTGSEDLSFNTGVGNLAGFNGSVASIQVQSDGRVVAGGSFTLYSQTSRRTIARLNENGSIDSSFNTSTGFSDLVRSVNIQSDGKIVVGGSFLSYNGVNRNGIARLNSDGTLDLTFVNLHSGTNVYSSLIQPDGKIIIAGSICTPLCTATVNMYRLNPNGSIDGSFNIGSGFSSTVFATALQPDGKVLAGGDFSSFNGSTRGRIARLNADGSLDMSFNPGIGFNGIVEAIKIQADGKIIAVGQFTSYDGTSVNHIARLNTDGTLDVTFNTGTGFDQPARAIAIQGDGKILVGGDFLSMNGTSRSRFARLNSDGSVDLNFSPTVNNTVRSITMEADGKIIIGGFFNNISGDQRFYVAKLLADGSTDANFYGTQDPGFGDGVFTTAIQTDSKIVAGGTFNCFNSNSKRNIVRLLNESCNVTASAFAGNINCNGGITTVTVSATGGTAPYSGTGTFERGAGTWTFQVIDVNGCTANTTVTINQPAQLQAFAANTPILCNGGTATVGVTFSGGTGVISGIGNYTVTAGTYTYNIFDSNGCTASTAITVPQPLVLSILASPTSSSSATANASGGTGPYTYLWSNGQLSQSVGGLQPGTYSVTVYDGNGCSAMTSVNVGLSIPLAVNAGGDEIVLYGYGPSECTELNAEVYGGTPPYSVIWNSISSGGGVGLSLTACPSTNEVYTVTVFDANGLSASDQLSICVIDVVCNAGNSSNQKVEMCQIPPGNPNNAHTICIDASAVPAHLAIGCTLGACGELENCNNPSGMVVQETALKGSVLSTEMALTAYPNPTRTATTISLTSIAKGDYTVVMTDMTGRVIETIYNGFMSDYENMTFDVDMSSLTSGIYLVNVIGSNGIMNNLKIVKE